VDTSVYQRANKPLFGVVKNRREFDKFDWSGISAPLVVHASTECHVTPTRQAQLMASHLEVDLSDPNFSVCEGSAGTGQLVQAVMELGILPTQLTAIEREFSLCRYLTEMFRTDIEVINDCFLDFSRCTDRRFDRLILNPPFKKYRQHIEAAVHLLKPGGILIALLPITFDYENEGFNQLDVLPSNTFEWVRVNTQIVRFQK